MRKAFTYPVTGALLALGAPLGLLVVRSAVAWAAPWPTWLLDQLRSDVPAYAYLVLSTATVFALLGWRLGSREDLLEERATTDPLTGVANRRHFEARLAEELARSARYGTPLSLLMVDVDGLKKINDAGGHEAGDVALRAVGQALRAICRKSDSVARTGGDEFAVLAPMTAAADAAELAERLRGALRKIARAPTVSIGVADSLTATTAAGFQGAADRALYAAKTRGRDRVVLAEPPADDAVGPSRDGQPLQRHSRTSGMSMPCSSM